MTLDEYERLPNAKRLMVAMAMTNAAIETLDMGRPAMAAGVDTAIANAAAGILLDYCSRRERGRGIELLPATIEMLASVDMELLP